jgi:hypothetical protein
VTVGSERSLTAGVLAAGLLAAILTAMDVFVLAGYDINRVWAWLQVPVLILAWVAPIAWLTRRWLLAGLGLLAMLAGLWGYLYLPPLGALVLAGVAFHRAARRTPNAT